MFYITLQSDASFDIYPDSTISRFRVRLPRLLDLARAAWELGLRELANPKPATETELQLRVL